VKQNTFFKLDCEDCKDPLVVQLIDVGGRPDDRLVTYKQGADCVTLTLPESARMARFLKKLLTSAGWAP
jgi:hypothetical protein